MYVGPGRQLDRYVDGLAATEWCVAFPVLGSEDLQATLRVLDPGLLCSPDVRSLRAIARTDVDDGVGAVARDDADVADAEVDDHVDGFWGVEARHKGLLRVTLDGGQGLHCAQPV